MVQTHSTNITGKYSLFWKTVELVIRVTTFLELRVKMKMKTCKVGSVYRFSLLQNSLKLQNLEMFECYGE